METADETVVIVGAGHAGGELAAALRQAKYSGRVVLIGDEPMYPYARPPLSKAYLKGESSADDLWLRHRDVYERHAIDVRISTSVDSVDLAGRTLALSDGARLSWNHLVLATGGIARTLPALANAANVHCMRTKADADALRQRMHAGARAVVIGGGYIGLEFAAVARSKHVEVTLVEAAPRLLARVSSPVISAFYHRKHRENGVDVVLDATITDFDLDPAGDVTAILLANGRVVPADFVLVGIGLTPRADLAEAAGLAVQDGILVDAHMRTSAEDVYAIGDVARYPDPHTEALRRLESVPNASEHARVVAAAIAGVPRGYEALPWFWSDQYDIKLQVAGLAATGDQIVLRGDPQHDRSFMVLHRRDGAVTCAEVINDPAGFAAAKRLIAGGHRVSAHWLQDVDNKLKVPMAVTSGQI
jgi:3-phenylpropionate/trans-cinnamate dioxygenase ferredoxin reductase subunit